ncbi:hypothetical protein pb186bvf_019735 [Paramecium bursaria]
MNPLQTLEQDISLIKSRIKAPSSKHQQRQVRNTRTVWTQTIITYCTKGLSSQEILRGNSNYMVRKQFQK